MYFITISKEKEQFKKKLTEVRTDETGWIHFFVDKSTNKEWVEYYPYKEDKAPSILKRVDISSNLEELMHNCLSSYDNADWVGLGAELSSGLYKIEEIAKVLQANAHKWSDKALKEFRSSFRPLDNRNIIGMKVDEIEKTYLEFLKSKKILENIIKIREHY